MDYWCALWFWPIDQVDLLPDRDTWWFELSLILRGQVFNFTPEQANLFTEPQQSVSQPTSKPQQISDDLFAKTEFAQNLSEREQRAENVKTASGELNLEKLFEQFPRLKFGQPTGRTL